MGAQTQVSHVQGQRPPPHLCYCSGLDLTVFFKHCTIILVPYSLTVSAEVGQVCQRAKQRKQTNRISYF